VDTNTELQVRPAAPSREFALQLDARRQP
jgi:hypothetical protein